MQDGFKIILGQSIQEPFKALFAFAFSMYLSWKLTMFIVLFAPIMAWVIKKFGKKMRRASRAMLQKSSHMLGQIESTLDRHSRRESSQRRAIRAQTVQQDHGGSAGSRF